MEVDRLFEGNYDTKRCQVTECHQCRELLIEHSRHAVDRLVMEEQASGRLAHQRLKLKLQK
eukprot:5308791-Prorocentrum_lima.AAC.1